jgi:hypothetical protein
LQNPVDDGYQPEVKVENPKDLPSGAEAHPLFSASCSTTKQAAEKGLNMGAIPEKA